MQLDIADTAEWLRHRLRRTIDVDIFVSRRRGKQLRDWIATLDGTLESVEASSPEEEAKGVCALSFTVGGAAISVWRESFVSAVLSDDEREVEVRCLEYSVHVREASRAWID